MEITILGTGTAAPRLERNASGLVVCTGGSVILVDLGPGTLRRLCEAGIDYRFIDVILVTHFHPDHVSDLVPLLFASNYDYGTLRNEPFHLIGPEGLEQFYQQQVGIYRHWIVPKDDRLIVQEMHAREADCLAVRGSTVRSVPAEHAFPSLSYRIEREGRSVTVSGDTDVSGQLVELARGTDVLICECGMPDALKTAGHLIPSEAGRMAAAAGVGRLVLTHFYPPCDEVDVVQQARAGFPGEIIKARDLMVISV